MKKDTNMKIEISGHHVEITEAIKQSVENKFSKIGQHYPDIMSLKAIVTVERNVQKIEVSTVYEGVSISVNASDKELYSAIASAVKKLESSLSHRKGVLKANLHSKPNSAEVLDEVE